MAARGSQQLEQIAALVDWAAFGQLLVYPLRGPGAAAFPCLNS
jgi:hypothetical protein